MTDTDTDTAIKAMITAAKFRKWQTRYYMLAHHVATWSKDPSSKVGAVVIGFDRHQIALGYNGFPPGIDDSPARYNDRQKKYLYVQHAERNALDNATFNLRGGTIACTHFPCIECVKSIINKGIVCVICPEPPAPLPNEPSWRDHLPLAADMLREAHVAMDYMPVLVEETVTTYDALTPGL